MQKSLVIVESPTKAKTISRILGKEYTVTATVGHIMDLPQEKLGVDLENDFEPQYRKIKGKTKLINEIVKAAKNSSHILIATDPDREGEAIARHIAQIIGKDGNSIGRVLFHEITKNAIQKAIDNPLKINDNKVDAQQARRILDRLVGYLVSPLLWKTVAKGLSAGRVQSVALRLICEREDEIKVFVKEEYWTIDADLEPQSKEKFRARLASLKGRKLKIPDKQSVDEHLENLKSDEFILRDKKVKNTQRSPKPPYITSTMQQDGGRFFRFGSKRTMGIAQSLYEGVELGSSGPVGLITYMRTDSVRSSPEAVKKVRDHIADTYGTEYVPGKPRFFASKGRSQDAHEAIRPTDVSLTPKSIKKYLKPDQFKLYSLIYMRFVASQMANAIFENTSLKISAGDYELRASGSVPVFRGYLQVWKDEEEEKSTSEKDNMSKIPSKISVGETLKLEQLLPDQHFTEPPPRFSESTLVKTLDELGIGRPSTYASIISVLLDRKYVEKQERALLPTELGFTVKTILINNLPEIFSVSFTAQMEDNLDNVEAGELGWNKVIGDFYTPFSAKLESFKARKDEIKKSVQEKTGERCEKCGGEMIIKWGRNGKFMACGNFPECRNAKPLSGEEPQISDEKCPKCGGNLLVKNGRYGKFLGCANYPKCKHIGQIDLGIDCSRDDCEGKIVEKKTKKGRVFYGCSKYPKCDFVSWYLPVNKECPDCGNPYVELRSRKTGDSWTCPKCKLEMEPK